MTSLELREALVRILLWGREGPRPGAVLLAHDPEEAAILLPGSAELLVLRQHEEGSDTAPLLARIESLRRSNPRAHLSVLVLGGGSKLSALLWSSAPYLPFRDPVTLFHAPGAGGLWSSRTFGRARRLVRPVLERALREARVPDPPARTLTPEERELLLRERARSVHSEESAFWQSLETRPTWALFSLAAAVAAVFVLETLWGGSEFTPTLFRMGANVPERVVSGEPWRLFSAAFLHIGALHIVVNLWALRVFGMFLERLLGSARFLVLYGVSALGGSLATVAVGRSGLSAGASGAIWGLMVAGLAVAHWPRGLVPESLAERMKSRGWPVLLANALLSFTPGIDLFAHFGGGLAGGLLVATGTLAGPAGRRGGPLARGLATLLATAMAASVAAAIVTGRPWELVRPPSAWARVAVPGTSLSLEVPRTLPVRRGGDRELPGQVDLWIGDRRWDPVMVMVNSVDGEEEPAPSSLVEELRSGLEEGDAASRSVKSLTLGGHPTAVAGQPLADGGSLTLWLTARGRRHVTIVASEHPGIPPAWRAVEPRFVESLR